MKVQIDDALSDASKVERGVPQGSFLLFFLFRVINKRVFSLPYAGQRPILC